MVEDPVDREVAERARELYWGSDRGVNSIANELGLSKGRFYGLIDPLPADSPCPTCGGPTVYENRSARDKDQPTCPACAAAALGRPVPPTAAPDRPAPSRTARPSPPRSAAGSAATGSATARVIAGFLIGGLVGVLLHRFVRR